MISIHLSGDDLEFVESDRKRDVRLINASIGSFFFGFARPTEGAT